MKKRHNKNCSTLRHRLLLVSLLAAGCVIADTTSGNGINDAQKKSVLKRDPFWPVGYKPEYVTQAVPDKNVSDMKTQTESGWDAAMNKVNINGVSSGADNQFCAVINGELKEVNEKLSVNYEGAVYTWEIESIAASGSVKLRRVSVSANR